MESLAIKWKALLGGALFLLIVFFIVFFPSSPQAPQGLKPEELKNLPRLEVLDVVLRRGIDYDSFVIRKLSNSDFSHVGVVVEVSPLKILHASSIDTQNRVAVSPFPYFLQNAQGIAVKRYGLNETQKKRILEKLNQKIGAAFSFNKEHPLYCTTLLEEGFGKDFLNLTYQNINLPVLGGDFLMPEAFYQDSKSTLIFEYLPR